MDKGISYRAGDSPASRRRDDVGNGLRARHLVDHGAASGVAERFLGQQGEQPVRHDKPSQIVNHDQPVAVSVVGQASISPFRRYLGCQAVQRAGSGGIGGTGGEPPVRFAVQLADLAAQLAQQLWGDGASRTVSCIHHQPQRSWHVDVLGDRLEVLRRWIRVLELALAPLKAP